jgi:hypothetical protein
LTAIARAAKSAGDPRSVDQLRADALLDLLIGEGVAVGEPLTYHTGGLPEAAGPPGPEPATSTANTGSAARATGAAGIASEAGVVGAASVASEAGAAGAAGPAGVEEQWDPAWPVEPLESIGAHDVRPDPTGEPTDRWDQAGRSFDGPELWPVDWPGRWMADPAVVAAGGDPGRSPRRAPTGTSDPVGAVGAGGGGGTPSAGAGAPLAGGSGAVPPGVPMPTPRRGVVELLVPLTTLLRLTDLPGELQGFGPVVADIARQVAEQSTDAQWRFSVYNRLGELVQHGITTARPIRDQPAGGRRPTAEVAAFVRARNRTCVAPGCRRPSRGCDLDHTVDWVRGGETATGNLGPQCRLHHRFKHTSGADVVQSAPGYFGWTTPRGLQYVTRPDPPLLDEPGLGAAEPGRPA